MSRSAAQSSVRSKHQDGLSVCLLLLLAFGVRLLYVPLHLAHEEHLGLGGHLILAHSADPGLGANGHDHEHDESHEHHDGHAPHSALDHALELLTQNVNSSGGVGDLACIEFGFELPPRRQHWLHEGPRPRVPTERGRVSNRSRGPPETV